MAVVGGGEHIRYSHIKGSSEPSTHNFFTMWRNVACYHAYHYPIIKKWGSPSSVLSYKNLTPNLKNDYNQETMR